MTKASQSPGRQLYDHIMGDIRFRLIHAVTELGIADFISAGRHDVDELAEVAGVDADVLYRVLRALASFDVFVETDDRTFDLTDQARLLRDDPEG
ncbi:MAG: methyltransferase family protein, partial [Woeseiaceae bacterium]